MEKSKPSRYLYLLGFKFFYAERGLDLSSCLHDDVVKSAPCIGKYMNTYELYIQCPIIQVTDTSIHEIENVSCISSVMKILPVLEIEREK